jgi:uncharacterized protein (DUF2236 family)
VGDSETRPAAADDNDEGLFGPGSVAWRVHADPATLIGGIRALLMQALHPLAMAGVVEHTAFRDDLWGRLGRTHEYVLTTVYGSTAEAEAAAARVRGLHQRVNGVDPETSMPYDANDPDLLRWVHDVEVQSFLVAYRRYGARLSATDADRYVAEMARAGELVGLRAADAPHTVAALRADIDGFRPQLRTTAGSRAVARLMAWPPLPLPLRPVWGAMLAGAVATIPGDLRRLHALPPAFGPFDLGLGLPAAVLARIGRLVLPSSPVVEAARARVAVPA